jgi:hypothetical protein
MLGFFNEAAIKIIDTYATSDRMRQYWRSGAVAGTSPLQGESGLIAIESGAKQIRLIGGGGADT